MNKVNLVFFMFNKQRINIKILKNIEIMFNEEDVSQKMKIQSKNNHDHVEKL